MREILFRGKRKYSGEWVYGYLVKLGKESFSDSERHGIVDKAIPTLGSGVYYNLAIDEVIPETVGQYTGFTDTNGKKIFEGDIVNIHKRQWQLIYDNCKGEVYFNGILYLIKGVSDVLSLYAFRGCCEIIGNIHDNPELLGENNNG